jgi:Pup-ligase protein
VTVSQRERLFGAETEYALAVLQDGVAVERMTVLQAMMHAARRQLVHLPDLCSGGMFLSNGGRLYVDCGEHYEYASPECSDPRELVRYVLAGHRILEDLSAAAQAGRPAGSEVLCFRCNVDYCTDSLNTWGAHESYLHQSDPVEMQAHMIPHLVSRIVYTGAGGFNPLAPGLEFSLSPRAAHFRRVVGSDSTSDRAIFHTKDESLSHNGCHRLHVICGESLCSETALFLKFGVTALIVSLAEAGLGPGTSIQFEAPLDALRTFAADPSCRKTVRMKNWQRMTAIDIQRHYLEAVESHLDSTFLPVWSADVCRVWRDVLDRLAADPRSTSRLLDWSLKFSLYADQAAKIGLPWDRLTFWNEIASRLRTALKQAHCADADLPLDVIIGPESPIAEEADRLTRFLQSKGMHWDELQRILRDRHRLFEIDLRFGQLGPQGIFHSLDAAGLLQHRIPGVGDADQAVSTPPASGRARVRGEAIRRLANEKGDWRCDWQCIANYDDGRTLDLSNPRIEEEIWKASTDPESDIFERREQSRIQQLLDSMRRRAL